MTNWELVILTALGSGVFSSIVTTYGTQTRERRQARAQAREAIRQVQTLARDVPTHEQLTIALDNLETSAMLARLPEKLTGLNRDALYIRRNLLSDVVETRSPGDSESASSPSDLAFAVDYIAGETLELLISATWHPIISAPYRWWRTRQLLRVTVIYPRFGPRSRDKRRWERETIRRANRERMRGQRTS